MEGASFEGKRRGARTACLWGCYLRRLRQGGVAFARQPRYGQRDGAVRQPRAVRGEEPRGQKKASAAAYKAERRAGVLLTGGRGVDARERALPFRAADGQPSGSTARAHRRGEGGAYDHGACRKWKGRGFVQGSEGLQKRQQQWWATVR